MLQSNQLQLVNNLLFLFIIAALISSCCAEDEPSLKSLQICEVNKDDLDKFQCDSDNASLTNDAPFITASVKAYHTNPTDRLVFKLYDEGNGGTLVSELSSTISQLESDAKEDQCEISAAVSLPRNPDVLWPDADLSVEVSLENGGIPITISKRFSIR